MKRILAFILIAIASYASMVIGKLQEHPFLLYAGMVVGGMLALGLVVWLIKKTAKFIGWAMTSVVYLVAALSIIGLLAWNDVIPNFAGFTVALVLSVSLCLVFVRRLARWAQKSLIGGEIFSFVSNYQLKSYISRDKIIDKDMAITCNVELKNLIVVLRSLDYSKAEAKEAAYHVLTEMSVDTPLSDKIKEALKYLGGQHTVEVYKASQN